MLMILVYEITPSIAKYIFIAFRMLKKKIPNKLSLDNKSTDDIIS